MDAPDWASHSSCRLERGRRGVSETTSFLAELALVILIEFIV